MITLSTRLALHPRVRFRRFENEGILLDQKSGEALVISDVAARLIELADGQRTLSDSVEALTAEYDAERTAIESDVLRFAEELVGSELLSAVER